MKVHAYLLYKQIAFDVAFVNPVNPSKLLPMEAPIPVLRIGDQCMADSHSIGLWLDGCFPERSLLSDKESVIAADLHLNQTLIPMLFYSIYPQLDRGLIRTIRNTIHLGYCVDKTVEGGLPPGIRFLWPLFLRNASFIKRIIGETRQKYPHSFDARAQILEDLNKLLQANRFIAATDTPSMADISAWPLLVVPYQLSLYGFDDFFAYQNIKRRVEELSPMLLEKDNLPCFVPNHLKPLSL